MKNQKKNSEKKENQKNENWMTPQEAAAKLGIDYAIENTHAFRVNQMNVKSETKKEI